MKILNQEVRVVSIRLIPDYDKNSYEVTVQFYVVNTPTELVDFNNIFREITIMINLQVTELDFDDIKENLKTFLKLK